MLCGVRKMLDEQRKIPKNMGKGRYQKPWEKGNFARNEAKLNVEKKVHPKPVIPGLKLKQAPKPYLA